MNLATHFIEDIEKNVWFSFDEVQHKHKCFQQRKGKKSESSVNIQEITLPNIGITCGK